MTSSRLDTFRIMFTPSRIVFFLLMPAMIVLDQYGLIAFRVFLPFWICLFVLGVYLSRRENRAKKTQRISN